MRLYLMRHGIAIDRDDPECPAESERYLTPKGAERTRIVAGGLTELRIRPTTPLTSPFVRAVQTGEIVCEALDLDPKQLRATDALKPDAKPARLAEELSKLPDSEVICFGHAPHLDDFIAYAVKAPATFTALRKAGVACLDIESFSPLMATLAWLLTSRALRHLQD
jgi:phosphohistidine phosphatase SixA